MKLLIISVLFLIGACTHKQVTIDEYRFGDTVDIIAGEYAGGSAVIANKVAPQATRPGCSKEYAVFVMRRGFWLQDFVCHEDLDPKTVR